MDIYGLYSGLCVLLVEPLRAIPYDPHGLRSCCACSALAKCSLAAAALEAQKWTISYEYQPIDQPSYDSHELQ